jgi:hypothetical protein
MKKFCVEPRKIMIAGMLLDEWTHKSCIAHVGAGEDWATIYDIESFEKGKGHATKLLSVMKVYYTGQGKKFGSTVTLNSTMDKLLKKLNIPQYEL